MGNTRLAMSWGFTAGISFFLTWRRTVVRRRAIFSVCCRVAALACVSLWAVASARGESVPVLVTQNIDEGRLVTLRGNTRPEANAKNDRGRVSDDFLMEHLLLLLRRSPEQERELEELIDELHDPSAPVFHQWLTAREFGERFGVSEHDRDAIKNWMKSNGLTINVEYPNHMLIDFSGTAGRIAEAFHTEIHHLNVKGERHIANMSDAKIPAALAPAVAGIVSMHDFWPHALYRLAPEYTAAVNGTTNYLVTPGDLATIYNLNPLFSEGISGQGQTIVAVEISDVYTANDWTAFRSVFGLSTYGGGSLTQIHPAPPSGTNNCSDPGAVPGADLEASVDAEYASAAAPSAAIVLASCAETETFGALIALANLLNQSSAPPAIVSMSYGECEAINGAASNAAFNSTFQQAVAEGVSVFVGSGDHATAGCDEFDPEALYGIAVSGFASSAYDVAVGGTDFGDTYAGSNSSYWAATNSTTYESAQSYIPEIPWNDSCASVLVAEFNDNSQTYGSSGFCNSSTGGDFLNTVGGGGGPSGCATGTPTQGSVVSGSCAGWPKPSYQTVLGNPNDGVRDIPDVSLFAANGTWLHYYPICFSADVACSQAPSEWPGAGGTSFSAPIMAGIQSLVNQNAGSGQGNPNYVYYGLAAAQYGSSGDQACNSTLGNSAASSCIFYDVTQGDNDVPCLVAQDFDTDCYQPSGGYGVLSTSDTAYQPAYATATGWDFPTGIGSVNAYNLVTNWPLPFTLLASPNPVTIAPSGQATSTITIIPASSFSGSVMLSVSGLPSGVTAGFDPNPATSASTLTLAVAASTATGTFLVTVTGTSGSATATTMISLTVPGQQPSFTILASPGSLGIPLGVQGTSTINITPTNGFSGNVTFAASGLPSGVTPTFNPNPATTASALMLTASGTATLGTATLTVTGTSGSLTAMTALTLTVMPGTTTVSFSPASLSFGSEAVNNTSTTRTVTVKNTGTAALSTSSMAFALGIDFTVASNSCGSTLGVNKTCKVSVTFTPTQLGAATDTLSFTDNAANSPQTVALAGTGTADATLTPASATYAKQALSTTSAAKTFTLTNNQSVGLTSIAISTTGDFAVSATTCGTSLNAKAKCTISVTFTPTGTGTQTGQLIVNDSGSPSPQTSNLTGTGT